MEAIKLSDDQVILDSVGRLIPFIKTFFIGDVAIGHSDLEKYHSYYPGKDMDHKIRIGDRIKPNGLADRSINQRKTIFVEVDASVFGFAYTGMAAPILNSKNQVIGSFYVLESLQMKQNRDALKNIASNISKNMIELNSSMSSLLNQSENINSTAVSLEKTSEESMKQVEETNDVLTIIKNIANKTNLLGINAAIEATRAGKEGSGFKVVSDEIRTLSTNTNDSIKKAEPIIKQVHVNSKNISAKIHEISGNTTSIVELINQTKDLSSMISILANQIDTLADQLVHKKQ